MNDVGEQREWAQTGKDTRQGKAGPETTGEHPTVLAGAGAHLVVLSVPEKPRQATADHVGSVHAARFHWTLPVVDAAHTLEPHPLLPRIDVHLLHNRGDGVHCMAYLIDAELLEVAFDVGGRCGVRRAGYLDIRAMRTRPG
jgi:hypothetical protein